MPVNAAFGVYVVRKFTGLASVAALSLCWFSLLQPSMVAGMLLLLGLWTLMAPQRQGRAFLRAASPYLTMLLATWYLASYVATFVARQAKIPVQVSLYGPYSFTTSAVVLPLSAHLLLVVAFAGLTAASVDERHAAITAHLATRMSSAAAPLLAGIQNSDGAGTEYVGGGGGTRGGRGAARVGGPGAVGDGAQGLLESGSVSELGSLGAGGWEEVSALATHFAQLMVSPVWYLGFVLVPMSWFLVGVVQYSLL